MKSELEVKSVDHIVKIDDLATLKMELKVEQKSKAKRTPSPIKKSATPTTRKVSNTKNSKSKQATAKTVELDTSAIVKIRDHDEYSFEPSVMKKPTPRKRAMTPKKIKVENPEEPKLTPSQKRS